jgi:hypothetical protein
MFYKKCYEISKTKLLRCEIKDKNNTILTHVIENKDEKFFDLITEKCIIITDKNLYAYEQWSDDIKENNEKLKIYANEQKTKIDFLQKISKENKEFCQNYILCKNSTIFLSNYFDNDLNKFIEFKKKIIHKFCDEIYEELKSINSIEIKNVLNCIEQIKTHNFSNFNNFKEVSEYWPDLLRPNPFSL